MILQWAFLLLPVAATCGWWMGRHHSHKETTVLPTLQLHSDYFKGLNYLINDQPDKAVDIFIKLLSVDGDTVETHLALGSLFRRRGEVDRAIRVHQNLIARPQLEKSHRLQALSELGQDYLRAGVLDRAERLFLELVDAGEENQSSLRFLLHIYQQEKEWDKAISVAQKLKTLGEPMSSVIAQYNCELAEKELQKNNIISALDYIKKATSSDAECVRANLIRAQLEMKRGDDRKAIICYQRAIAQDAAYVSEMVQPLMDCYIRLNKEEEGIDFLKSILVQHSSANLALIIADYFRKKHDDKTAIEFIAHQIRQYPSLRGLAYLVNIYLVNALGDTREKLMILDNFIQKLVSDKPAYRCTQCGFSGKNIYWLCPSCHHWNTVRPIQGLEGI